MLKTLLHTLSSWFWRASNFHTSAGMLSSPVALPVCVFFMADVSSSFVNSFVDIGSVPEMTVLISSDGSGRDAGCPRSFSKCSFHSLILSIGFSPDALIAWVFFDFSRFSLQCILSFFLLS